MRGRTRRPKVVIDRRQVIRVVDPIAALFHGGGMDRAELQAAFSIAIDHACRARGRRRLEHVGTPGPYADLIALWMRDRRFLDVAGRPRCLSWSGRDGFTALARRASPGANPRAVFDVLVRYGNVRRLRDGKLRLVSNGFRSKSGGKIAFDPLAGFLYDATSTLTRLLNSTISAPEPFWRTVACARVSRADAREFAEFARERGLLFLDEMDDWLQAHRGSGRRAEGGSQRVGLGLFSIHQG